MTAEKNKREIVDAREDEHGNITAVRFKNNVNFTSAEKAMEIGERDGLKNAHVVKPAKAKNHLRTNADSKKRNNLDEMAKKNKGK